MLPERIRGTVITRIMRESIIRFNHAATAEQYIQLYERMLQRPLLIDTGNEGIGRETKAGAGNVKGKQPASVIPIAVATIDANKPSQWNLKPIGVI